MVRVKRGKIAHKRRERLLKNAKGFRWGRKSKYAQAKQALFHAWSYSYRDRRNKKREARKLWQVQINAACKERGLAYSRFIHFLKLKNIQLDRKILSTIAKDYPQIFDKILEEARAQK